MSHKESTAVVVVAQAGQQQQLITKFKSRTTKDVESPKSVISDPRIVSPASSASASLERRISDLKKLPRHDRVYSISDAEDDNVPVPSGVSLAAVLTRQLSAKDRDRDRNGLESVSEAHSLPSVPGRMGLSSGPSSETSSPRNRIGRSINKDGSKVYVRGSDTELLTRRLSSAGADSTSSSIPSSIPYPTGDGRSGVAGYRHTKSSKSVFSPGDSPGHPPAAAAFGDWPRSALLELSSEVTVVKETSKFIKEFPEMPYSHKESSKALSNGGDSFDSVASIRLAEGRRKSESHVSGAACIMFPSDGHPSLHALPPLLQSHGNNGYSDGHYEKNQYGGGGKYPGVGETIKTGLMPQQRFGSGQYLKSNPLKPRPPPAKWEDAEKWIQTPSAAAAAAAASSGRSSNNSHGNGPLSGGSTPQHHILSGRHHLPRSAPSNGGGDILQPSAESYDARLLLDNGDVGGGNSFSPSSGSHHHSHNHNHHHHHPHPHPHPQARDASTTTSGAGGLEDSPPADTKQSDEASCDGAGAARPEGKVHPLPDGALVKANLLLAVNKLARERSERGPGEDFCESKELQEPLKSPPGCTPVDTTEPSSFDQKHDAYSATIFDNFTKDKFADSITVQSTSPNNGRLVIVMKDAATEITPSTSQRDIATQITPVQSFHAVVTPPRLHTGPARLNTTPVHSERRPASVGVDVTELQSCHQAKLELDQAAALDNNWTTREEEVEESAKSLRLSVDFKEVKRNVLEARAAAWEEAEQSKYMSRYHREEAKILAWEAHQKAKAEAEMRKMEVKLERMRSHASEILQNKIASVHLRAENMRAAAAAQCGEQAAKTNQWAQEIRTNGRSPTAPILCCFPSCFNSYTS